MDELNKIETFDVFVYCGGKCGSSTLNKTFNVNGDKSIQLHSNSFWKSFYKKDIDIFKVIDESCLNKKIYIIDSYRTPIERKISSFFQNLVIHEPNYRNMSIEDLILIFNRKVYWLEEYHPINEVLSNYELPLFKDFDFEKHYNIIEKDNKIFIKILFKDIKNWDKILSEIFNKEIIISPLNLTEEKCIFSLYQEFKKKYKVPKWYLVKYLPMDEEFKIYNTIEEQNEYMNYWMEKSF